jgi:hypothetical protein
MPLPQLFENMGSHLGYSASIHWSINAINLILKAMLYHFSTYDELVMSREWPQHTKTPKNAATMMAELLATPATPS